MNLSKLCLAIGLLILTLQASAQDAAKPTYVDIGPQPLASALQKLAEVQKVELLFLPADVKGLSTKGVHGNYTPLRAAEQLLEGTGLVATSDGKRAIAVKPAAAAAGQPQNPMQLAQATSETGRAGASERRPQVPADAVQLEAIRITATKREERLLDVPMSVGVVTRGDIERRGSINAEDYLRGMPGVNQVDGVNGPSIVIRGMETSPNNQNAFQGATTATYFGETPTTSSMGLGAGASVDLKLVDIERVEVLRGPQGTAFGNASIGGAVRTIPVAPRLDRYEGSIGGGYSVTSGTGGDNYNVQAVLNVPIVKDQFAVRGVAYDYQESGFYVNRAGSDAAFRTRTVTPFGAQAFARDQEDVGSYYARGGRLSALFRATSDLKFALNLLTQRTESEGFAQATSGTYEQTVLQVAPEHVFGGRTSGGLESTIDIANAIIEYNLGWVNVLGTYSRTKSGSRRVAPLVVGSNIFPVSFNLDSDHREDVGEIRFATALGGAWEFLGGVYVEEIKDDAAFDFLWFANPATNFFAPGQRFTGAQRLNWNLKQKAAFGEASWTFLKDFTLTGGARHYDYDRTVNLQNSGALFGNSTTTTDSDATGNTLRANLAYRPNNDALMYVGWSQGFRLGKPQAPLPGRCDSNGDGLVDGTSIPIASTGPIKSDSVDNYEIGGKFALLGGRMTVDAAAFRMKWTDIPVSVVAGTLATGCGLAYVTNVGTARSEGLELQANFQVTRAWRVSLGASWVDARLTEDTPAQGFKAGARLPGAPKVNGNLGMQYDFVIARLPISLRADAIYVGEFYGDVLRSPNTKSGDYYKLDASARVLIDKLKIDFFVRNATGEDAFTFRGIAATNGPFFGYRLRPRTVGLQATYAF